MKTIGLIGGMSWESTAEYYRILNQRIAERCGGLHSAKVVLYSVDFADIEARQRQGDWTGAGEVLADAARRVAAAGADLVLICTNTMHIVADAVSAAIDIPLLHIVDVVGQSISERGMKRVGLLGTKFTMERDFYAGRLRTVSGIDSIVPDSQSRNEVNRIIFEELCLGRILPESKRFMIDVIRQLAAEGAEGVVLACTELPLLVQQSDTPVTLFDTTAIHAEAAVAAALQCQQGEGK